MVLDDDDRHAWNAFLQAYGEGSIQHASRPANIPNLERYLSGLGGWLTPPTRSDESARMAAVKRYSEDILQAYKDAGADLKLDKYTRLAATLCETPISLLNLLDTNTQWVTSEFGLSDWRNITLPRSHTFCAHTVLHRSRDIFCVLDAQKDWRFAHMPMVEGPPHVQYYMGAPLTTSDGQNIGALCVLDTSGGRKHPTAAQQQGLIDIADMIMSELDLRADRLVAQKAKRVFLSSISHELRSPLHGILASTELLVDDGHLTSFQDVCARTINNCGRTLCDVIEQVLSVSDSDAICKKDEVYLPTFVEEIVDATWAGRSKSAEKKDQIEVLIDVSLTHLRHTYNINRGEIGRIIMNLFGNAIKYTERGFLKVHLGADQPAFNRDGKRLQYVNLTFSDSGKGIEPEFLPKIFSPFAQQDSIYEGFGLGMSLVKQLVENNNGTIRVESEVAVGTQVHVTLLLEAFKAPTESEHDLLSEFTSLCGLRFCIYDSQNLESRSLLKSNLTKTCRESLQMQTSDLETAEIVLIINPNDLTVLSEKHLNIPIVIFAPDVRTAPSTHYLQTPVGPFKLGRALITAITNHEQSLYTVRRTSIVHLDPISPPTSCNLRETDPLDSLTFISRSDSEDSARQQTVSTANSTPQSELSAFSFGRPKPTPLQTTDEDDSSETFRVECNDAVSPLTTPTARTITLGPRCLCVDDNNVNLRILASLLSKNKLRYETATDGEDAMVKYLAALKTDSPFDIVFMDINMPKMNGIEATRLIREKEKENSRSPCTIVALTGGGPEDKADSQEAGIDHYFLKPVSMKVLSHFLETFPSEK